MDADLIVVTAIIIVFGLLIAFMTYRYYQKTREEPQTPSSLKTDQHPAHMRDEELINRVQNDEVKTVGK